MTLVEALRANISDAHGIVLSDDHYNKTLTDQGLNALTTYTAGHSKAIDRATIALYDIVLGSASMSEGGLTYSVNKDEVRACKEALEVKLGLTKSRRAVRARRVW